ncbi:salt tolerance-like protein [Musa troglodytarum]|nr:salt tolerance-like protein [Musa troglodytarum]
MRILCDVCGEEEASVFCCADEAALCGACDRRVHRANKLAGKHRRLSLSGSSAQSRPACDICQEKRGFLFCHEDRAILCRDCDASVHSASHLTMKHSRFLLTGARLSAAPIPCSPSPESEAADKANAKNTVTTADQNKASVADGSAPSSATATTATSSISEYLINMCPGWRVEDLLVDDAAVVAMEDFSKGDELPPFPGADLEELAEKFPVWAPQVPQLPPPAPPAAATTTARYQPWNASKEAGRERWSEDLFAVPQISPASTPSKRPRHTLDPLKKRIFSPITKRVGGKRVGNPLTALSKPTPIRPTNQRSDYGLRFQLLSSDGYPLTSPVGIYISPLLCERYRAGKKAFEYFKKETEGSEFGSAPILGGGEERVIWRRRSSIRPRSFGSSAAASLPSPRNL